MVFVLGLGEVLLSCSMLFSALNKIFLCTNTACQLWTEYILGSPTLQQGALGAWMGMGKWKKNSFNLLLAVHPLRKYLLLSNADNPLIY